MDGAENGYPKLIFLRKNTMRMIYKNYNMLSLSLIRSIDGGLFLVKQETLDIFSERID